MSDNPWLDPEERLGGLPRFKVKAGYQYVVRIMGHFKKYGMHREGEFGAPDSFFVNCPGAECPLCRKGSRPNEHRVIPVLVIAERPVDSKDWRTVNRPIAWAMTKSRFKDNILAVIDEADDAKEIVTDKGTWKIDLLVKCANNRQKEKTQEVVVTRTNRASMVTAEGLAAYKESPPDLAPFLLASVEEVKRKMNANTFSPEDIDGEDGDGDSDEERPGAKPGKSSKRKATEEDASGDEAGMTEDEMLAGLDEL